MSLLFLAGFFPAAALAGAQDCYRRHLREAIALNQERAESYAAVTGGVSRDVTARLLRLEKLMLATSYMGFDYDAASAGWEAAGFSVTCEAFVPMSGTPAFRARFPEGPPPRSAAPPLRSLDIVNTLKPWSESRDIRGFLQAARRMLHVLEKEKRVNCLTRHGLESMMRVVALIPSQEKRAITAGVSSPAALSWRIVRGHLWALELFMDLDERALPLNLAGVPILCFDVPAIPLP